MSDTTICVDGSVDFEAVVSNDASNVSYQWHVDGTAITGADASTFHYDFTAAGDHEVVVEVQRNNTNTANCIGFDTTTIKVSAIPEITVEIALPDTICNGQTVTINVTPTAGSGIAAEDLTYTWYRDGEILNGVTGTSFTDDPVNNSSNVAKVIYGVTANQASSGCQSVTKYDTLYIQPAPEVQITGTPLVCFEDTVKLTANVSSRRTFRSITIFPQASR